MKGVSLFIGKVLVLGIFLIFGLTVGKYKYSPVQQANAQACTVPTQVSNVLVSYPSCPPGNQVGVTCDFTQAGCSWDAFAGATNYQVVITQVESGTVVYNQQVPATTLNVSTAITQNKTYKCDVSAINSCGTGPAGSNSLLCAADAAVTVSPTIPPTAIPFIKPTVPPTGSVGMTVAISAIALGLLSMGAFLLIL